jgi:hypothetical protein
MNGLRISEALGVDIDDLDVDRGHRTLRVTRKGGKQVTIPLAPRTARALDLYIGERASGPIFLGIAGARMDRYAADRTVKRLARRAGITKRMSPHSLRHSFITAALDAGVPLRDVQEAASHVRRPADDHALRPGPPVARPARHVHRGRLRRRRRPLTEMSDRPGRYRARISPGRAGYACARSRSCHRRYRAPSSRRAGAVAGMGLRGHSGPAIVELRRVVEPGGSELRCGTRLRAASRSRPWRLRRSKPRRRASACGCAPRATCCGR